MYLPPHTVSPGLQSTALGVSVISVLAILYFIGAGTMRMRGGSQIDADTDPLFFIMALSMLAALTLSMGWIGLGAPALSP